MFFHKPGCRNWALQPYAAFCATFADEQLSFVDCVLRDVEVCMVWAATCTYVE